MPCDVQDQSMYPPSYYRPESDTAFRADKEEEVDPLLVPEEELQTASFSKYLILLVDWNECHVSV